jgi:long-chain fatty acid transport protein
VAYKGFERTLIDLDLRYLDYKNTDLFGTPAPPRGNGLGWRSVVAVALGGQYQATDRLTLCMGYLFNINPIPSARTLLNVQLPAISQHLFALGATLKVTEDIPFTLAYSHAFRNSISGPIAQFPGTSVREEVQVDSIIAGLNIQFGGKRRSAPAVAPEPVDPAAAAPAVAPEPIAQTAEVAPGPSEPTAR